MRLQRVNCLVDVWIIRMCFISEHVLNLQPWPVTCKRHHDPICGQCSKAVSTHILSQKQSGRFVFVIHCHKGPRHSYFSPWPEKLISVEHGHRRPFLPNFLFMTWTSLSGLWVWAWASTVYPDSIGTRGGSRFSWSSYKDKS